MCMHAEAIVDLVEKEHQEVQFRQVQGDFSVLQGKFMLQKGPSEVRPLICAPPAAHLPENTVTAFHLHGNCDMHTYNERCL